jgi:hypothetical protein
MRTVVGMGVLHLLDDLPEAITRSPSLLWSVFARSLGEQGAAGRTALAWRWALTGACPSPVTLATATGRPPSGTEMLAEAQAAAELAAPSADPGGQVMQARFALEWMTGKIDALPLWNTGTGEFRLTDGASFARTRGEVEAAYSWALLAQSRYPWRDGSAPAGEWLAFAWARGTLDLLAWACGEACEGPFSGDRVFGRPSLYQVSLDACRGMTGVRMAREAGDSVRAGRVEAVMETFLWLAGWNQQPSVDRHGHGTFENCPERAAPCSCDAGGQCVEGACEACRRVRCVHGFTTDESGSPQAGYLAEETDAPS